MILSSRDIEVARTGLASFMPAAPNGHNSERPDGQIHNTFCQFRNVGLDPGNIRRWRITGGTRRVEGNVAAAYDMRFISSNSVVVSTNGFERYYGANATRTLAFAP